MWRRLLGAEADGEVRSGPAGRRGARGVDVVRASEADRFATRRGEARGARGAVGLGAGVVGAAGARGAGQGARGRDGTWGAGGAGGACNGGCGTRRAGGAGHGGLVDVKCTRGW